MDGVNVFRYEEDQRPLLGGGYETWMRARFMVDKHGPFTAECRKDANWEFTLRGDIEEQVRKVRSVVA